jgi:iron complex outermembrane receptor protein
MLSIRPPFAFMLGALASCAGATEATLDEVIVTARYRTESVQNVPMSISVTRAEDLVMQGITHLGDLQKSVPNAAISAARGTSSTLTAYIRGIGQEDPLWGYESGVGLYIDDVYIARPQGALLDTIDLERIEVLRGPQGTLYGKNALGGAIRYITRKPDFSSGGKVSLALGSYDQRDVAAQFLTPVVDNLLAASLSIADFNRDGFGTNLTSGNDVSDKDVSSYRFALRATPAAGWDIDFASDATKDRSNVKGAQRLTAGANTGIAPLDDPFDVLSNLPDANLVKTEGQALTISAPVSSAWSVKSISAYREGRTDTHIDFDTLNLNEFDVVAFYDDDQITQEIQLSGRFETLQIDAGYFFLSGHAGGAFDATLGQPVASAAVITTAGAVDTESHSMFLHASYRFASAWTLALGARHTHEHKSAVVQQFRYLGLDMTPPPDNVFSDFDAAASFDATTPQLVLQWDFADSSMAYLSYAEGFKSGGFNMRANDLLMQSSGLDASKPFDEETVKTSELGIKGDWLSHRLKASLAAFYMEYDDIQITTSRLISLQTGSTFATEVINGGNAITTGAELELSAVPLSGWDIRLNAGYLDADYKEFTSLRTATPTDVSNQQEFVNAPRWTTQLYNSYTADLNNVGVLSLWVNYSFRAAYFPENTNSALIRQDSFGLWDAGLVLLSADSHWQFAVTGKNLRNEEYRVAGYNYPPVAGREGSITGFYGDPRTVTVSAQYQW